MPYRKNVIAALRKVTAGLSSPLLRAFYKSIIDLKRKWTFLKKKTHQKLLDQGIKPGSQDYKDIMEQVYYEDFKWVEDTNVYFENAKIKKNIRLVHFTDSDPVKLQKILSKSPARFKGLSADEIGLTSGKFSKHIDNQGTLGFAYPVANIPPEAEQNYGDHAVVFTATEAVEVFHNTDEEIQMVWDANFIKDVEIYEG